MMQFTLTKDTNPNDSLLASFDIASLNAHAELRFEGGTISSGMVLMEIVPKDESLIVQAKIPTNIIDKVRVDMPTDMRFTAFNSSTTPVIPGRVKVVGADKEPAANPQEGEFYLALVETTKEGLDRLAGLKVQPGMPVDVVIKAGERSFMSYLLKPLTDKMARAFKD